MNQITKIRSQVVHMIDDHAALLNDEAGLERMRANLRDGHVYIARNMFEENKLRSMIAYFQSIGRNSLPNYSPIEAGAPNSHRMSRLDERAHVATAFHQFMFFPWNQDVFDLFEYFKPVYHMKNRLSGLPAESFLGREPENGCTARLAFQLYPRGIGFLNPHRDPVDYHQLVVPIMLMSRKGVDYQTGGLYVETEDGVKIDLEDGLGPGDVIYFNAKCIHGVDPVDPSAEEDWLSYKGRWMLLFAVNKVADNQNIPNSVDLGRPK